MKNLIKEIEQDGNVIIFIDEIHTIVGAGAAEGSIDASNMLKPALARGVFQCIGATTLSEFRKNFEKDGALNRRFQTIPVDQPDTDETVQILDGIKRFFLDTLVSFGKRGLACQPADAPRCPLGWRLSRPGAIDR